MRTTGQVIIDWLFAEGDVLDRASFGVSHEFNKTIYPKPTHWLRLGGLKPVSIARTDTCR